MQIKTIPDQTEIDAGICHGKEISVVQMNGKNLAIVICYDITGIDHVSTKEADLILFIYHFTCENYKKRLATLTNLPRILPSSIGGG